MRGDRWMPRCLSGVQCQTTRETCLRQGGWGVTPRLPFDLHKHTVACACMFCLILPHTKQPDTRRRGMAVGTNHNYEHQLSGRHKIVAQLLSAASVGEHAEDLQVQLLAGKSHRWDSLSVWKINMQVTLEQRVPCSSVSWCDSLSCFLGKAGQSLERPKGLTCNSSHVQTSAP